MTLSEIDTAIIADLDALKLAEEPVALPTWPELQAAAEWMLIEMNQMQLQVVLTPSLLPETARNGGMIRSVVEQNPEWYQRLCAQYPPQRRRPRRGKRGQRDTAIKRQHTLSALRRIASGHNNTVYTDRLMPFVREFALGLRGWHE